VPPEDWIGIPVPAIVEAALFDAVNEQLAENRARQRQARRGARYLLQGLLVCQGCGHAFYGKPLSSWADSGKRYDYAYYRCIGMDAHRFGGQRICGNRPVRTDRLDAAVWADVRSLLMEPERIEREYQRRLDATSPSRESQTGQNRAAVIKGVQRAIARLIDAYEDGLLDRPEFEPRIHVARERLTRLQAEAQAQVEQETEAQHLRLAIGQLQEFTRKLKQGFQDADWRTQRELILALVKRIEISQEGVRVVYRVSPSPFPNSPERGFRQHCPGRVQG
jgi:site-specific DNA recombinase